MIKFIVVLVVLVLAVQATKTTKSNAKKQSKMKYKKPHYSSGRTTMVQLFEWKWKDIATECETFLGPMGFGGVQISPPNENLIIRQKNRPWWERYQPISYRLITRSGNEKQFARMVRKCNNVGVRIYVDAVINHMTSTWKEDVGTGGNKVIYKEWYYPAVPYSSYNFNWPHCVISKLDYGCCPEKIRNCELNGLKDLSQHTEYVRDKIVKYMNHLIDLGVAGFRIDSAKHMWPSDLKIIYNRLLNLTTKHGFPDGARPYIYQEVIDFGGEAISVNEYTNIAAVTEFKFGLELSRAFQRYNKLTLLNTLGPTLGLVTSYNALTFIDNHDNQRGRCTKCHILNYKKTKNYKGAVAFMLAYPYGYPRLMSSYSFVDPEAGPPMDGNDTIISPSILPDGSCGNGWICEHRWSQIYNMVAFRNIAGNKKINEWWDNGDNQVAFCRGAVAFAAFNNDVIDLDVNLQVCVPAGTYCDVISGYIKDKNCTGKIVTVGEDGQAHIVIRADENDMVLAIHVGTESKL